MSHNNHPLHCNLGRLRVRSRTDGMDNDLHSESSEYSAESSIAGFKPSPDFHLCYCGRMHQLACRDSGSPGTQGAPKNGYQDLHLFMAVLAVIESWLLIHTVFTLRYAHVFYRLEQEADVEGSGRGLIFPGGDNPDYEDFAYFSFVIGMTCQVSDVNITSRFMRRLALLHGLLSFAFNTVILALSINIISGLFVN